MSTDIQQPAWVSDLRPSSRLWVLLLLPPLVATIAFATLQPIKILPRISLAPGYSLIDQDGNRLTNEALRGSIVIYNFTPTQCAAPCPETSKTLREMQAVLDAVEMGDIPLQFVTISTDPTHDTPEALNTYAKKLGADTNRWHFASGDPAQLKMISTSFQTTYAQNNDGSFTTDPVFALVDGWGILRALYHTATPDVKLLQHDLQLVVDEAQKSQGINHYAYEAAHLFLCHQFTQRP
jgi:protein SCO1